MGCRFWDSDIYMVTIRCESFLKNRDQAIYIQQRFIGATTNGDLHMRSMTVGTKALPDFM